MLNFIVNLKAGKGRTRKAMRKMEKFMKSCNLPYKVYDTAYPGNAIEIAHRLSETENARTVIAVGGDGTFNEVLNGINPAKTILGFIPSGSGNDFAKCVRLNRKPVKALRDIIKGGTAEIDFLEIGGQTIRRCLNIAGTGMDLDVLTMYNKTGKSKLQYYLCLFRVLKRFNGYKLKVTMPDGREDLHDAFIAGVCNGRYFGGGMKLSPYSEIDDGKLDLIIIHMVERSRIFPLLLKFLRGKHMTLPIVESYKLDEVRIECADNDLINVDGELIAGLDFNVKVIPKGLKIYVPPKRKSR
jgi:YegS/Rv2252/BmrU family lipid kinase